MSRSKERVALLVLPIMLSGLSVPPATAAAVEFSYKSAPQLRVFEVEREPLPELKLLIEPKAVVMAEVEPSILKRLFKALAGAVAPSEALAQSTMQTAGQTAGQSPGQSPGQAPSQTPPTIGFTKGNGLIAQDADPNFKLWQQMADERLKGEQALRNAKPHRLALLHPDQYIVVCEAGCRKQTEEIVYKVAVAKARAPVTRLEPTAAGDQAGAAPPPNAVAGDGAPEQAPDTILCVAGCYERPNVHQARKKVADALPAVLPTPKAAALDGSRSGLTIGREVLSERLSWLATTRTAAALETRNRRSNISAVRVSHSGRWQMRVIYEVPKKPAAAKRAAPVKHQAAVVSAWRTKVTSEPVSAWRTKITFAPAAKKMTESRAQLKRLAHVQQLRQALHPIHTARATHFRVSETRY